jgi:TolB-like protein/Tfp pilus assembly protein PilF
LKSYQEFFAELKRRKVFKVAAVYGVASFIILQVADLLGQGLRLGDTFLPFVTAIVLLGFPFALIMAWAFEMTPKGVQRTTAPAAGEIEQIVAAPISQRWPAGLMALVGVAALAGGAWWVGRQTAPDASTSADAPTEARLAMVDPADDTRPSIAVMPFADMSPEGDQQYFGDGMTEEILNSLIKIRDLRVSGRTSTFAYKGQDKDLRDIGSELGVGYLVEGSVRKAGDQLRITAQLIDASDGSHLWGDQYDRSMNDVFAIQTEIAEAIALELRVPLGLDAGEQLVTPTADLEAYDLYLSGRARMRERGGALLEARALLEAAVARDSTWAPAWAALAEVAELRIWHEDARPEDMTRQEFNPIALAESERAARRALELEPKNASALVALGSVLRNRAQWDESEATYFRALELDPDNAEAHQQYGDLLLNVGRIAEAVRALDRAAVLDGAPIRVEMLARALEVDSRLAEALEVYEVAVLRQADPAQRARIIRLKARLHMTTGAFAAAIDAYDEADRVDPDGDPMFESREQIEEFVNGIAGGNSADVTADMRDEMRASHWLMVGEQDSAVAEALERMDALPFGRVIEFRLPRHEPIRSDPRVQEWLAERGSAEVPEIRTPEAERTRPMVLREAGE